MACKGKRERRLAHLVGFDNCLANLASFPPLKAVGTGQVAKYSKKKTRGQVDPSSMKKCRVKPLEQPG